MFPLVVDEQVERLVDLVVDVLRLHLLGHQVVHDVVDAQVQLLHRLLAVLSPVRVVLRRVYTM